MQDDGYKELFKMDYKELHAASRDDSYGAVLELLKKGVNPNDKYYTETYSGSTPLHEACVRNRLKAVETLVKWGADMEAQDKDGDTPLHLACTERSMECVKLLTDHSCRVDIKNKKGQTALDIAKSRAPEIAKYIVEHKASWIDPLSKYPLVKQLKELNFDHCYIPLGCGLDLGTLELRQLGVSEHPTTAVLLQARIKNQDLKWLHIAQGLLCAGQCKLAEKLCCDLGVKPSDGRESKVSLELAAGLGWLDDVKWHVQNQTDANSDVALSPYNLAYRNRHAQVIIFFAEQKLCQGCLVSAARRDQEEEVKFLLEKCHYDANEKDADGYTPFQAMDAKSSTKISKLLLQHGARPNRKSIKRFLSERPRTNPLPILIIGNGSTGKSTLIKAMLTTGTFVKRRPVTGVEPNTVGIVTTDTSEFGRATISDFAGQQDYYSSHSTFLTKLFQSPPVVICCANLNDPDKEIEDWTSRWMTLVNDQCKDLKDKAHVIVIGSHKDMLEKNQPKESMLKILEEKESLFNKILRSFPNFEFRGFVPMDCRIPQTPEINHLRKKISSSSEILRQPDELSTNAHIFQDHVLASFDNRLAVSLEEILNKVCQLQGEPKPKEQVQYIPNTLHRLKEMCEELDDKGHIMFLSQEPLEKSYIICDKRALMSTVTGTVFAPEGFEQYCDLAQSTGVVPLSRFAERFKEYSEDEIKKLIAVMAYFEFCFVIRDEQVMKSIAEEHKTEETQLLFPALIKIDRPDNVWREAPNNDKYGMHFGWALECSQTDKTFADSHCLQVLILRLVFAFDIGSPITIDHSKPSYQKFCSIWKNGISWTSLEGIECYVELSDNGRRFILRMRSNALTFKCLDLRSQIINKILDTVKEICPNTETTESIIDPAQVISQSPGPNLTFVTLADFSKVICSRTMSIDETTVRSSNEPVPLRALPFDSYIGLDEDTLQLIHSEENTIRNQKISDGFISHFADQVTNLHDAHVYRGILGVRHISVSQSERQRSSPQLEITRCLQKWRDETEGTYVCLRDTLNKYSVFTERNPLDLACMSHSSCEDIQRMFVHIESTDGPAKGFRLTVKDLAQVNKDILDARAKWEALGLQLGVDKPTLDSIRNTHCNKSDATSACFTAMLEQWLKTNPTMESLIEALRSRTVNHADIASKLQKDSH